MVYLAMVREAMDNGKKPEAAELLNKAHKCHNEAVALVSKKQYGLRKDAEEESNEVKELNQKIQCENREVKA